MAKKFYVYNSFTDTAYCGNPAGVVPDADDLTSEQMQMIARQLNLVETVFILKDADHTCSLKYFMPEGELPIAGHPTIAAWAYLKDHKHGDGDYTQSSGAGPIAITLRDGRIYASQKTPDIRTLTDFSWAKAAGIFGITVEEFDTSYPAAAVDAGLGHLIFAVRSLDSLMKLKFSPEELKSFCQDLGVRECQIFSTETRSPGYDAYTRNLCPRYGLEDPACGNGNAALGAYFATFVKLGKAESNFRFEQGHKVNMPASIDVKILQPNGKIETVMIGGTAKRMIEGTIEIK